MKRLLIALGALTMIGATAAAEEFRPTGSMKQEIRWYSDQEDLDAEGVRFTLAEGGVRFTENFYVDYRVRDFIRTHEGEGSNNKDVRTRLYYDHGTLGNTEIDARQRLEVRSVGGSYNRFNYTPEFDFAAYVPGFTTFKLRPAFRYRDNDDGVKQEFRYGGDFLSYLPVYSSDKADLGIEFNLYAYKDELGAARTYTSGGKEQDTQKQLDVELYVYASYDLGTWNGVDFGLYYEFGMDPYSFYDRKVDVTEGVKGDDYDSDLYIYNDFEIQFSYAVNDATSIYGAIAAEFANAQSYGNNGDTANYKWQAYPYIGWRTKF